MGISFRIPALISLASLTACASVIGRPMSMDLPDASVPRSEVVAESSAGAPCTDCNGVVPMPVDVTQAIETRIAELKQRGGVCSRYGSVLEESYRNGRITIRPYMWRVGDRLASGEAKPNGEMTLAREVDPLNIGVRTVDDLLWSMEHEAAHIAFNIVTGVEASEDRANPYVRACRSEATTTGSSPQR